MKSTQLKPSLGGLRTLRDFAKEIEGKEGIAKVCVSSKTIFIRFSDDTFIFGEAMSDGMDDHELEWTVEPDMNEQFEFGLITQAELDADIQERNRRQEEVDRRTYKRLKAKFEGQKQQ